MTITPGDSDRDSGSRAITTPESIALDRLNGRGKQDKVLTVDCDESWPHSALSTGCRR